MSLRTVFRLVAQIQSRPGILMVKAPAFCRYFSRNPFVLQNPCPGFAILKVFAGCSQARRPQPHNQHKMKQNTQRKTPTEVHTFRCTRDELEKLRELAAECGLSLSRYVVAAALKHHPRKRLTSDEVEALNSLAIARTDLIKISNVLATKTAEEKSHYFRSTKFMRWWIDAVAGLVRHWRHIEENITSSVLTKEKEAP